MDFKIIDGGVCAAKGFKASGVYCAIKENPTKKNDIALIVSDVMCNAAGVYTSNKVKGAPVVVTKKNLENQAERQRQLSLTPRMPTPAMPTARKRLRKCAALLPMLWE